MLLCVTTNLVRRAIHPPKTIKRISSMSQQKQPPIQIMLKPPKGMRDFEPKLGLEQERVFKLIKDCFKSYGGVPLDTPAFERREILTSKYGEEAKLIYDLDNSDGGEALSARYDLTVPFARYLAQNKVQAMTRYNIGKVHRRDNPRIEKGRFREFYQCDIDFAGNSGTMLKDVKCLKILCRILIALKLPYDFSIKINHRCILNGMFNIAGVPQEKFKSICSSIDKLDKQPWDEVKKEMCCEKGLDEKVADIIGEYVSKSGGKELIDELLQSDFGADKDTKLGLEELKLLYEYADYRGISKHLKFDLSLARGLDYYTGLIFEAILLDEEVGVGSIAAGGRYDNLVSSLVPGFNVPCVGLSIGIERIFAILGSKQETPGDSHIHCYIGSIGKSMEEHRSKISEELRDRGFCVKECDKDSIKPLALYQSCEKENVPFAIFFGPEDIKNNVVCLKTLSTREDAKIPMNEIANHLEKLIENKP